MHHVLITGANRGLGLALTQRHAQRGDRVIATCRRPDDAGELRALADASHGRVSIAPLDVTDEASVRAAHASVSSETDALNVLYNNAGINVGEGAAFDPDQLAEVLQVNAVGAVRVASTFGDLLARGEASTLLNVSSQLGSLIKAESGWGNPIYNTSKAALNMLSRMLANAWRGHNVTVLAVHPGWVKTDMGGERATVEPSVAAAGLVSLVDRCTLADTGKFFTYEGDEHPW